MLSKRPNIKPILTKGDRMMEVVTRLLLLVMWGLTVYFYAILPETIPIHFNGAGEIDNYGNKATIFLLPVISTFVYALLSILNNYPYIFNYPVNITEENALYQYTLATRFIRLLNLCMVLLFLFIQCAFYYSATVKFPGSFVVFAPIVLFTLPLIIYVVKATKVKNRAPQDL